MTDRIVITGGIAEVEVVVAPARPEPDALSVKRTLKARIEAAGPIAMRTGRAQRLDLTDTELALLACALEALEARERSNPDEQAIADLFRACGVEPPPRRRR